MLTIKKIDSLKPKKKTYKVADSEGLYLAISPKNIRSWRYNYKNSEGKYQTATYGRYPDLTLADARKRHTEFREELLFGEVKRVKTFAEVFEEWYRLKVKSLSAHKHKLIIHKRFETYVLPKIGHRPIDSLKRSILADVVKEIDAKGITETAHRIALNIREVMDYAIDTGLIEYHAASGLRRVLGPIKRRHMSCVPVEKAEQLLQDIMTYEEPVTRLGLLLLAHTFVRTKELRYFERAEIDGDYWIIPGEKMKMDVPHVVPLTKQSKEIIEELKLYTGESKFILESPSRPGHPISENTLLFALYRLGYKNRMTGHGFRSLASTVLNQTGKFHKDAIERQLAHKETDDVRAAYNRAEYLDERIKMMQWYSVWLAQKYDS